MTRLVNALRPRDQRAAARVLAVALVLAFVATVGWEVLAWVQDRPGASATAVVQASAGLVVVGALGAWVVRVPHRVPLLVWPAVAVLQPLGTALTVVRAGDASAGAQFGLVYAVVFAASQFGRAFAWAVTALAVAADAFIAFAVLDPGRAASDLLVVACALPMITIVLGMTNAHGDRLHAELDALATTDALTGLGTRRALEAAAVAALTRGGGGRHDDPHVGLVLLDVDHFKSVNDRYGHPVGDAILVHLGRILRAHAGHADVVARLGGDEIAVLVHGDPGTVTARARALHEAVRDGMRRVADLPRVSASAGCAVARPTRELEELYRAADRALYEAKARGRDRLVVDEPPDDAA